MPLPYDHFTLIAPFYDRICGRLDASHLWELLRLPVAGRVLDVGGGTGRLAQHLRDRAGQVVVSDLAWGMLRQARRKPGLTLVHAAAERLPFPDAAFERVFIVDAFHHLHDHAAAARELRRVLAPGGRLVIEEPDIAAWPVKLVALAERLLLMRSRFFAPAALASLLAAPGFTVTVETDGRYTAWVVVDAPDA